MKLTVLICTHNRVSLLEKAICSLNAAARPATWNVEILVAANACTDGTHEFLENYTKEAAGHNWLPLTWFCESTPGK